MKERRRRRQKTLFFPFLSSRFFSENQTTNESAFFFQFQFCYLRTHNSMVSDHIKNTATTKQKNLKKTIYSIVSYGNGADANGKIGQCINQLSWIHHNKYRKWFEFFEYFSSILLFWVHFPYILNYDVSLIRHWCTYRSTVLYAHTHADTQTPMIPCIGKHWHWHTLAHTKREKERSE